MDDAELPASSVSHHVESINRGSSALSQKAPSKTEADAGAATRQEVLNPISVTAASAAEVGAVRPALARARSAAALQPVGCIRRPAASSACYSHDDKLSPLSRQLRSTASSGSIPLSPRMSSALVPQPNSRTMRKPSPSALPPADVLMGQRVVIVGLPADSGINGHGGTVVGRATHNPSMVLLALNTRSSLDGAQTTNIGGSTQAVATTNGTGDASGEQAGSGGGTSITQVPEDNLRTLLYFAASNGIADTVTAEINAGISKYVLDWVDTAKGRSALWSAAFYGEVACVLTLVASDADLNLKNRSGFAPLWVAAQRGHDACVEVLLTAGAVVDLPNMRGTTPLMAAAMHGHAGCVKLLLHGKADVRLTQDGLDALGWANAKSQTKCASLLQAAVSDDRRQRLHEAKALQRRMLGARDGANEKECTPERTPQPSGSPAPRPTCTVSSAAGQLATARSRCASDSSIVRAAGALAAAHATCVGAISNGSSSGVAEAIRSGSGDEARKSGLEAACAAYEAVERGLAAAEAAEAEANEPEAAAPTPPQQRSAAHRFFSASRSFTSLPKSAAAATASAMTRATSFTRSRLRHSRSFEGLAALKAASASPNPGGPPRPEPSPAQALPRASSFGRLRRSTSFGRLRSSISSSRLSFPRSPRYESSSVELIAVPAAQTSAAKPDRALGGKAGTAPLSTMVEEIEYYTAALATYPEITHEMISRFFGLVYALEAPQLARQEVVEMSRVERAISRHKAGLTGTAATSTPTPSTLPAGSGSVAPRSASVTCAEGNGCALPLKPRAPQTPSSTASVDPQASRSPRSHALVNRTLSFAPGGGGSAAISASKQPSPPPPKATKKSDPASDCDEVPGPSPSAPPADQSAAPPSASVPARRLKERTMSVARPATQRAARSAREDGESNGAQGAETRDMSI